MHEHKIGLFYTNHGGELATVSTLQESALKEKSIYKYLAEYGGGNGNEPKAKTIADYADRRRNVGLVHFTYCPECGEKIDWKKIRRMN